ncbi:hypothetical protein ACILE2_02555 [Capnocytophaga canimorsus]|uniref:hypothetical protein n=1 Tax=Capnocytophaga canimorsus TaxID=28188 RepID=UPI0037CD64E2
MKYRFGKGEIVSPLGIKSVYATISYIENDSKYGCYFWAEVNNIKDLEYTEEIVEKIEEVLSGKTDFYEGFGFELYMIECDREKAIVKNIFEDDKVEAIIPIQEVYELMRDWRDYLREFYGKK